MNIRSLLWARSLLIVLVCSTAFLSASADESASAEQPASEEQPAREPAGEEEFADEDSSAAIDDGAVDAQSVLQPQSVPVAPVDPFDIAGVQAQPGRRVEFRLQPGEDFLTGEVQTWGMVVHGTRPGPVLCLIGGIHGDELNGVEIVRRVLESEHPDSLHGTLVGVPIVNSFGFVNQTRYLPDRRDLNRYFPGRPEGPSHRVSPGNSGRA